MALHTPFILSLIPPPGTCLACLAAALPVSHFPYNHLSRLRARVLFYLHQTIHCHLCITAYLITLGQEQVGWSVVEETGKDRDDFARAFFALRATLRAARTPLVHRPAAHYAGYLVFPALPSCRLPRLPHDSNERWRDNGFTAA